MRKGTTRLVFLLGKYAIKIPNFTYSWQNFLTGCLANCNERTFCKQYKGMLEYNLVAKTYFSSWFGLINIQERLEPLHYEMYDPDGAVREFFKGICSDIKSSNFGFRAGSKSLVCLDYAI